MRRQNDDVNDDDVDNDDDNDACMHRIKTTIICIRDEMRNVRVDGPEGRFLCGWFRWMVVGQVGGALIVFVLRTITLTRTQM